MYLTRSVPDLETATSIASSGFCQPISDGLRQDVASHLSEGEMVYTIQSHRRTVGFAIFSIWDDVLYLGGIILDAEHQRQAAVHAAVQAARSETDSVEYLALRTQSLRMWIAGSRICSSWFPTRETASPSQKLARVGQITSMKIGSAFPIGVGCYGGPLYGRKPIYRDLPHQEWWDSICNFERGDAVICVGVLQPK